ncbi:DCD domain-containing protein [Abeliophyllum distichum]|uniref:DCD domain-containing protein n=1 Tax=Abeliophyllum distichum TaxID=126358 RepID=A0ABD1Q4Z0_9LAMI
MVRKGKKKASTSNKTLNENEVAQDALVETENSDSMIVNMEQTKGVAHSENKETTSINVTKNEEDEETKHEEGNVIMVDNSGESAIGKEMNLHNLTEKDQKSEKTLEDDEDNQELNGHNLTEDDQESEKIPEDDEDNQEDSMEEDDEEETSEEENEENDTFEDEDSEGDATEEEEDDNEKNAKEEKKIAEGDSGEAEECNEEIMGALRKKKVEKMGERSRKKVEENSIDNDEDSEEEDEDDDVAKKDKKIGEGDGQNDEERNAEKLETSSKEKVKKSRQRSRKKKVEGGSSKKVASGAEDKPESSTKKKSKKRAESMGMIFMCSSQTKNDCYHHRVLGLPASKRDLVKKIYKGMRLFLYDVDLKLMYGIYKAAGPGGYNIEPKAFKSQFPSQVRFTVFENCLPLAEEKFKKVIKDNYFTKNKFDCQLTSSQVKKLCELFVPARKVDHGKKVGRMGKADNRTPLRREKKRRRQGNDDTPMLRERNRRRRGDDETPMLRERNRRRGGDDETPMLRERNRRRKGDDGRPSVLRDERWRHERPRKRRRDAVTSPVAPQWQPPLLSAPAPQPLIVPSYAYSRTPEVTVYRLDPYLEGRDTYRRAQDPYFDRRDPYREVLDPYVEHRDSSRDGRRLAPQDTFRREPISERPDVYSHDRLVEYRDSYRHDELLGYRDLRSSNLETRRRDEIGSRDPYVLYGDHSSNLETRRRDEIVSREPYVSYRDRPSYVDRLYSAEHHSRTGLLPEYRPVAPITDNLSTRGPLPDYRYRGALSRY